MTQSHDHHRDSSGGRGRGVDTPAGTAAGGPAGKSMVLEREVRASEDLLTILQN